MKPELMQLPKVSQAPVQEFISLLQALAGEHLRAMAVLGETGARPIRSVVVLDAIELDFVRQLGGQGAALGRMGLQAPLLMTPEYIRASLDAFPIELLDIQQRHVNVLGEDYFAPLTFKKTDVRLELERELKREIILIRQGVLSAGDRPRLLADVYEAGREQTLRLLRAAVWLHDRPIPVSRSDLVRAAGEVSALDLSALALDARGSDDAFGAVQALYKTVNSLANGVDRLAV